jgi:nucleoid-associated protein YgaU
VRQLESEKAALTAQVATASASSTDASRVAASLAETEGKLATSLRSYNLLTQERDELNRRVTDLTHRMSAAEAQAKLAAANDAAATVEALRSRTAAAEQAAEAARLELARVNRLLAANPGPAEPARPPTVTAPSRPTAVPAAAAPQPALVTGAPAMRTHTIAVGDTLSAISRHYYGTPNRWPEILAANRDWLRDERSLIAGRILRIP